VSDDARVAGAAAVTVVHFAPGALALGRLLAASLAPGMVRLLGGGGWPTRAARPGILGSGLLWFGLYMVTFNWGERDIDAGTGMAVPLGGVLVVGISESDGGRTSVTGVVLCLVVAVCYAGGVVCPKLALRHASAVQVTTFGCFTGAAARLPFAGQLLSQLGAPYNPRGHNLRRSRPSRHGDQRAARMTTGTVDLVREDY
jgi:drug/metabolite transporter (DMT)-like permease